MDYCFFAVPSGVYYRYPESGAGGRHEPPHESRSLFHPRPQKKDAKNKYPVPGNPMKGNSMARPTSVTVIAWVWIALGILLALGGVFHLSFPLIAREIVTQGSPDAVHRLNPVVWLAIPLGLVEIGVSVLAIVSGAYFLSLKRWARTCLEVLSWSALIFYICFGVGSVVFFLRKVMGNGVYFSTTFTIFWCVFALVFPAAFAVPFGVMIKALRGKTIRDALVQRG